MGTKTITMSQGKGSLSHNNREFIASNIHPERIKDNIIFAQEDLSCAYEKCYDAAVEKYNAKQKRADRKIKDGYFKHLFSREPSKNVITGTNKQKSFYEDLVQIGTKDDTGVGTADAQTATQCLSEYMKEFTKRNKNLYVFNAVLHLDEATPHLHIDYIPLGHFSHGLETRNAMAKALEEMGFGNDKNSINRWRMAEWEELNKICTAHGIEISQPKKSRGYTFTVNEFKKYKDDINALESEKDSVSAQLNDTKKQLEKASSKKAKLIDINKVDVWRQGFH